MKVIGLIMVAAAALGGVEAWAPAVAMQSTITQPRIAVRPRSQQALRKPAVVAHAQPVSSGLTEEEEFEFVDTTEQFPIDADIAEESTNMFALGGVVTAVLSGAYLVAKKFRSPTGTAEEKKPIVLSSIQSDAEMSVANVNTLLDVGRWMTQTKKTYPEFAALATFGSKDDKSPKNKKVAKKVAKVAGSSESKTYANIQEATAAGLVQGVAPFPEGVDLFKFFNGITEAEAKRYADVEITHGRVCMLAALGFLVGEQVEGSSFLFDANVTGPAINHFQQVPATFWGLLGAVVFVVESGRVQIAWQNPFEADKLFLLKNEYTPGDYEFDPLNLAKGKDEAWLSDMKLKELNNGRVAMIAISGMVAQELVNGLNLLPADEVLEMGKSGALELMEKQCAGAPDEAACAKAFEAAERAIVFAQ